MISVVIPALNAQAHLPATLLSLIPAALEGLVSEVVVSDGGSADATREIADAAGARVVNVSGGRGPQLRAGAQAASKPWFLFLHADTRLEEGWTTEARRFIAGAPRHAAAFRFALADRGLRPRLLEGVVAFRCWALRLPYGDQGLLISRALYDTLGGFAPLPLMEDVEFIRRLGRRRLVMLQSAAITSAERFQGEGYLRRSARNLGCLALYLGGVAPERIARLYG
jgi:rSAM/selenodomain-associated transferase 2